MTERVEFVLLLAAATLTLPCMPERASACSCMASGIVRGQLADGAQDVPTDVQPWIHGWIDRPQSVSLVGPGDVPVATEILLRSGGNSGYDCVTNYAEIVPLEPLQENTQYTIRVTTEGLFMEGLRRFTTGQDLAAEVEVSAPDARLVLLDAPDHMNSCVYTANRACLGVEGADTLDVTVLRDGEMVEGFFMHEMKALELADQDGLCFEVRRRDAAGRRSEATAICTSEVQVQPLARDQYPELSPSDCSFADGILAAFGSTGVEGQPGESPSSVGDPLGQSEVDDNDAGAAAADAASGDERRVTQTKGCTAIATAGGTRPPGPLGVLGLMFSAVLILRRRTERTP